jgi:hypothetical protein
VTVTFETLYPKLYSLSSELSVISYATTIGACRASRPEFTGRNESVRLQVRPFRRNC